MRVCLTNPCSWRCAGLFLLATSTALAVTSCGRLPTDLAKPAVTAPVYVGEVTTVNRKANFVLIRLGGTATAPAAGTELTAISASAESVQLKVSAERKRPFVTADILRGTPKPGERVYR